MTAPGDLVDDLEQYHPGSYEYDAALIETIKLLRELAERPEPKQETRKGFLEGSILISMTVWRDDHYYSGEPYSGEPYTRTNYGHSPWVPVNSPEEGE